MNIVTESFLNKQQDVVRFDEFKQVNGKRYQRIEYGNALGYMAILRNLRNLIEADVDMAVIDHVASIIGDAERVATSKQFPFSFVKAAKALNAEAIASSTGIGHWGYSSHMARAKPAFPKKVEKLVDAIVNAIEFSLGNLPKLGDSVWAIVDCSGSMQGDPFDTACLFAAAVAKASKAAKNFQLTMFSDNAEMITIRRHDSVMSIYEKLIKNNKGGGTALGAAIRMKGKLGFEPDTVIVFSDMQINQLHGGSEDPMKVFGKNVVKVAINMQPYTTTPCHEIGGWLQLAGFSEKLFDLIPALHGKDTVVSKLSGVYEPARLRTPYRPRSQEIVDEAA